MIIRRGLRLKGKRRTDIISWLIFLFRFFSLVFFSLFSVTFSFFLWALGMDGYLENSENRIIAKAFLPFLPPTI